MSFFDRFLNAVRLNDDFDDDDEFYEDEDDSDVSDVEEDDDIDAYDREPARRKNNRFFRKMSEEEDSSRHSSVRSEPKPARPTGRAAASKVTPMRRSAAAEEDMEVSVIKPTTMENTREIADTLLENCTVILNLEGMDVELAQRIIDFSSGTCYAIGGNLQKVSSYIFILTPKNVEISGDIQDILNSGIPSIRTDF